MKLFNFTRVISVLALFVLLVIYISTGGLSELLRGPVGEDLIIQILVIIPFLSFGYVLVYTFLHENWYKYGFYFNKKENEEPFFLHKILHKRINKENAVKLILILVLLVATQDLDYGYYTIIKLISCTIFSFLAYNIIKSSNEGWFFIWVGCAVLFNPIIKFRLEKEVWAFVDISLSILLFASMFLEKRK